MAVNNMILSRVRSILQEEKIVVVSGIVNIEDAIKQGKGQNSILIDKDFIPFIQGKNFTQKKIQKDLEEIIHKFVNGADTVKVEL